MKCSLKIKTDALVTRQRHLWGSQRESAFSICSGTSKRHLWSRHLLEEVFSNHPEFAPSFWEIWRWLVQHAVSSAFQLLVQSVWLPLPSWILSTLFLLVPRFQKLQAPLSLSLPFANVGMPRNSQCRGEQRLTKCQHLQSCGWCRTNAWSNPSWNHQ